MAGLDPLDKNAKPQMEGLDDGTGNRTIPAGTPESLFLRAIINSIRQGEDSTGSVDFNATWDHWFNYRCGNFPRADVASVTAALIRPMLAGAADIDGRKFLPRCPFSTCEKYLEKFESDYPGGAQLVMNLVSARTPTSPIETTPQQHTLVPVSNQATAKAESRSQYIVPTGIDFAAQFIQQAEEMCRKKDAHHIEEDYDSDDDLEEFKAKWEAERLAKREEIEARMKDKEASIANISSKPPNEE